MDPEFKPMEDTFKGIAIIMNYVKSQENAPEIDHAIRKIK